ncbi:molybdate ABC transporter substrate-binding protein [Camelliibacillus cellulosilyticus]|uniref:Molybdate ABC transporter substrate-binding protein n=1 Tax=Camelliibacillus cellulosilyticus TaxID=2174486 RepID=A0ABV9GP10_9BACL
MRGIIMSLILLSFTILVGCSSATSQDKKKTPDLTVSAAASLSDALNDIAKLYKKQTGTTIHLNLASSGTLEQQIAEGAPVDLFISASRDYMDRLMKKGIVKKKDRVHLLSNTLVLITPKNTETAIKSFNDLPAKHVKKIAIGTLDNVPAGEYAKDTLVSLKLWGRVQSKLVYGKDVRQVLSYVETGNVDAGIVYKSDALISDKVRIADEAPMNSHDPITYPMGITSHGGKEKAARKFYDYLQTKTAQKIFKKYGFEPYLQ